MAMYCLNQAKPRSGFDLIVEGSEPLWLWDAEVAANLASQVVVDIAMPWNGTAIAKSRIMPPKMTATLAEEPAAFGCEVLMGCAARFAHAGRAPPAGFYPRCMHRAAGSARPTKALLSPFDPSVA